MVGFWRTQTIAAGVELGVFEQLPNPASEVARRLDLRVDETTRLLRGLAELSLVETDGIQWEVTPRGDFLRVTHPLTLADAALEYAGAFTAMWADLPRAVRANGAWRAPNVFVDVAKDASRSQTHHRMLRSYARHDYPLVPAVLGLRGDERVVDAGGGLGAFADLLLAAQPGLQVTVLDRPEVIAQAEQATKGGPVFRAGDLFEAWGLDADVVVLSRVLHDWDDAHAAMILRRARAALSPTGRIFVVEMLLAEDGSAGALCDLHLLMATGGRERTATAYESLLGRAGFDVLDVRNVAALPSVIVGVAK